MPTTMIQREVVVGDTLPDTVIIRKVPRYESYGYAVVNKHRVIVDPRTHRVVEIVQ